MNQKSDLNRVSINYKNQVMQKFIHFVAMLIIGVSTFSQQTDPSPSLAKEDYMKKSENQKTAAWVLLGGGAAFVLTGMLIPKGDLVHEGWYDNSYKNDGLKGVFELTGILSMAGSIPLFTASTKNKKRAVLISFQNETIPQIQRNSFVYRSVPSLRLKLNL